MMSPRYPDITWRLWCHIDIHNDVIVTESVLHWTLLRTQCHASWGLLPTRVIVVFMIPYKRYIKVSFHSRSQGSQASQQACVCDAYWYGNMVGTYSAKFGEGLRYSQSSRTCSTCEHPRNSWGCCKVWKQKTQVRNAPLFWRYSFGSYSFMWEVAKCDMHNHGIL